MKCIACLATALAATSACGATLSVTVRDANGAALEDAVAWAIPTAGPVPPVRQVRGVDVAQSNRTFVPLVTVVQVGTSVQFPNRDETRHHVYSFSAPKRFEIKLYAGTPAEPVTFDKPGEVVLGCNIHDNMIAYVYVVDTPWFGKAGADGIVRIEGLPAGSYQVQAWHHAQSATLPARAVQVRDDASLEMQLALKPRVARPVR
jgi:plastocyanin